MMKSLITIFTFFITGAVFAQIDHELRFDCFDHDETKCNPFAISSPSCPDQSIYKNNWRVSHGSPQLRAFSNNNPTRVAILRASNTDGISPKGEGIFIDYNFIANHLYTIEFILRIEDSDFFTSISIISKVANGLTAKTNSTVCGEETLPNISDNQIILPQVPLPFQSGNELGLISVSDFQPIKNYSKLWIYAVPEGFIENKTPEFIISHITITDTGIGIPAIESNTICCNQTFSSNSANPTVISGSTPSGGNGTYSFQWQKNVGNGWQNVASDKNYDPPTISQNTSYRRIVASGGKTSVSL